MVLLSMVLGFLFLINHGIISDCSFALAQGEATARNELAAIDQEHAAVSAQQAAASLSNTKHTKPQHDQDSKAAEKVIIPTASLLEGSRDDTRRLLIAAKEVENLMQKDYRVVSTPHRKPPINNHEPQH